MRKYSILLLIVFSSCLNIKKAENMVLADWESVKRVRATTDALLPCANDTILDFIHDSTVIELIQTNTDTLTVNDTTYVHYFDTVYKARTITRNSIITDNRELKKLSDTLTILRISKAESLGSLLQSQKATAEQYKARKQWVTYTIALAAICALLIAIIVLLLLKKLPIKL